MAGKLICQHTVYLYRKFREKKGVSVPRRTKIHFTMEEAAAYVNTHCMDSDRAGFYVCELCGYLHMTSGRNKPKRTK